MTEETDPIAITGIGLVTSVGLGREETWRSIQAGRSGIGWVRGLRGIPDGSMFGAMIHDLPYESTELKAIRLTRMAAAEALSDSQVTEEVKERGNMACAISGHMGDMRGIEAMEGVSELPQNDPFPWYEQIFPNAACHTIANEFNLFGPRLSHSTACASGLISLLSGVRAIRDGYCDIALAGGGEAMNALFSAGFRNMRALAEGTDPTHACRPFDVTRNGFVMGEGASVFVVEKLSHALERNARVYCTISTGKMLNEARHVTGLDMDSETLPHLIELALRQSHLQPSDIGYVNAHGTGTLQNDDAEMHGISEVFSSCLSDVSVSATKSMIGHLVKAAGCAELAVTVLAMRDGVLPPTINLEHLDPKCRFDVVPNISRVKRFQHALKLSLAFGGHLVGVTVSRWNEAASGFGYPAVRKVA